MKRLFAVLPLVALTLASFTGPARAGSEEKQAVKEISKQGKQVLKEFKQRIKNEIAAQQQAALEEAVDALVESKKSATTVPDADAEALRRFIDGTTDFQLEVDSLAFQYAEFVEQVADSVTAGLATFPSALAPGSCGPIDSFNDGLLDELMKARERAIKQVKKQIKQMGKKAKTDLIFTVPRVRGLGEEATPDGEPDPPKPEPKRFRLTALGGIQTAGETDEGRIGVGGVAEGPVGVVIKDAKGNVIHTETVTPDTKCRFRLVFPPQPDPPDLDAGVYTFEVTNQGETITGATAVP